jgi:hypothetical protein
MKEQDQLEYQKKLKPPVEAAEPEIPLPGTPHRNPRRGRLPTAGLADPVQSPLRMVGLTGKAGS